MFTIRFRKQHNPAMEKYLENVEEKNGTDVDLTCECEPLGLLRNHGNEN